MPRGHARDQTSIRVLPEVMRAIQQVADSDPDPRQTRNWHIEQALVEYAKRHGVDPFKQETKRKGKR